MSERQVKAAEVVKVLTEAKRTISDPRSWIKDHFAFGYSDGDEELSEDAEYEEARYLGSQRFCALGAIRRNNPRRVGQPHEEAEQALGECSPIPAKHTYETRVYAFNDSPETRHEDVLALFDLAIEQQCKIVREEAEKDDSHLSD